MFFCLKYKQRKNEKYNLYFEFFGNFPNDDNFDLENFLLKMI